MHWQKVTIVGVGLLGGSLGLAIKKERLAAKVCGLARRQASASECLRLGVVDECHTDFATAARDADLIILCTPIAEMLPMAQSMAPRLAPGVIVTDVGSVKGPVTRDLEPLIAKAKGFFVGSHPMAGGEKSGVGAAHQELFKGAVTAVTPTPRSDPAAVKRVEELWAALGSRVVRLSPEAHDDLVSRSSHLPHVVAAELVNYVLSPIHPKEQYLLCANGFKDTTRIASGSPEMWRDIAMGNRGNLARVLGVFIEDLQEFRLALEHGDQEAIHEFFEKARQRRETWLAHPEDPGGVEKRNGGARPLPATDDGSDVGLL
jgi:prephenate dehydrogenase